uniref:Protein-serine/threonine kinase n=1 Tax=Syphacia muris TaxID=451379 RepID=A0A0N5AJ72_9BILA
MRIGSKLLAICSRAIRFKLERYGQFQPSSLSIQQYIDFSRKGTEQSSFLFLRTELLVRLANIMQEINLLPSKLLRMPSAQLISSWYCESFSDILQYETAMATSETMKRFNEQLQVILNRHKYVVETMAQALIEFRRSNNQNCYEDGLQYFLDRFYLNRISIRMLQNQHLLVFGSKMPEISRQVGCIDPECDVVNVVNVAYDDARFLCEKYYLTAPEIDLECHNTVHPGKPITVVTVPAHLFHIFFELIKNAMRATVEHHGADNEIPKLKILIVSGNEDVSIEISDRGGGVSRKILERLFNYTYSTAPPPSPDDPGPPLAGYGYGLPLSRLYARYFHGDIVLVSQEGFGTRATVFLQAQPLSASEVLPIYGTSSKRQLTMAPQAADWSQQKQPKSS